ncbi:hypothetical protein E2C01_011565 [Portunus trituberculatus]|uniref:Uncharacterized protein n=1 Tax=Portunus trituberculatus TaxID=210409 RepID=A0A5B7DBN9_PORTR|nr:hypothetical protein [Portunus trituberculatus]
MNTPYLAAGPEKDRAVLSWHCDMPGLQHQAMLGTRDEYIQVFSVQVQVRADRIVCVAYGVYGGLEGQQQQHRQLVQNCGPVHWPWPLAELLDPWFPNRSC